METVGHVCSLNLAKAEVGGYSRPCIQWRIAAKSVRLNLVRAEVGTHSNQVCSLNLTQSVGQVCSLNHTRVEVGGDVRPGMQYEPY